MTYWADGKTQWLYHRLYKLSDFSCKVLSTVESKHNAKSFKQKYAPSVCETSDNESEHYHVCDRCRGLDGKANNSTTICHSEMSEVTPRVPSSTFLVFICTALWRSSRFRYCRVKRPVSKTVISYSACTVHKSLFSNESKRSLRNMTRRVTI